MNMNNTYKDLFEACANGSVSDVQELLNTYQLKDVDVLDTWSIEAIFMGNLPVIHFFLSSDSLHSSMQKKYAQILLDDIIISRSPSYFQEVLNSHNIGILVCQHMGAENMLESLAFYDSYLLLPVLRSFFIANNIVLDQNQLQLILLDTLKRRYYNTVDEWLNDSHFCQFHHFNVEKNIAFVEYAALARDADLLFYIFNNHLLHDVFKVQYISESTLHNMQTLNLQQHLKIVKNANDWHLKYDE